MTQTETKEMTLAELGERASAELPEGWEIQVVFERGYGGVDLYDPAGRLRVGKGIDDPLDKQVLDSISHARELGGINP